MYFKGVLIMKYKGFSLIEVLIALAIFSIGILAVVSMQIASVNSNNNAYQTSMGMELASGQLENLMRINFTDTELSTATSDNPHTGPVINGYSIQWTVTAIGTTAKQIIVLVQWRNRGKSVTMTGLRSITDSLYKD